MRLDLFLVNQQLVSSRTQAQDLIENGFVYLLSEGQKTILKKTSFAVDDDLTDKIFIEKNSLQKYVSRGGLKLESAIKNLNLNIVGKIVLDVGQSTGGFTDCLIQSGAQQVIGIDVGHGQLHPSLKNNKQIIAFEGLHVKDISTDSNFISCVPIDGFDLIVMDVSFISLIKTLSFITPSLKKGGNYLFLVKPQFECGPEHLDKNGIVKNTAVYTEIAERVKKMALQHFNNVEAYIKSDIIGKDGNQEFFVYGQKN